MPPLTLRSKARRERSRALRPLDGLTSIRSKLGAVIVFAVAVTILIMYVTIGFALRKSEQTKQSRELVTETQTVVSAGFNALGRPTSALNRVLRQYNRPAVVVDPTGAVVIHQFPVPPTTGRALAGEPDSGTIGNLEYYGYPIIRQGHIVGAVYLAHEVETGSVMSAIRATASFVRSVWWQLLLAGAIAAVIALFLARFLARGMTQPIRDMATGAERLARGEYRERVPVSSRDELGRLAETFNRMAGELENIEKLRRDLVANVSHELKTPIAAIRAHLENLLDGVEEPNAATLAVMLGQSERLTRLVEQLLDLSRLESGDVPLEREPVPLAALVDRVLREIRVGRIDRGVELRNLVPADAPPVWADRERVHQVLFNLLDNALRFTPQGGTIAVRAEPREGRCEISVEDSGKGIPDEHRPFVFERFYRVDPSRSRPDGGTGIGLTIARSVVEAHGGRIWVEAREGGGSVFRFALPFAEPAPDTAGADAPPARPVGRVAAPQALRTRDVPAGDTEEPARVKEAL
ncbi:MAG TPA: HAMP domain-containing sensor histidine kinase [Actinomycetota bacterium]|nr:HAMP domain-containing sensor histidine kinase [Actinomycetota bacterium]